MDLTRSKLKGGFADTFSEDAKLYVEIRNEGYFWLINCDIFSIEF